LRFLVTSRQIARCALLLLRRGARLARLARRAPLRAGLRALAANRAGAAAVLAASPRPSLSP
jgi:hypothetical protein